MERRSFLSLLGGAGTVALAGCTAGDEPENATDDGDDDGGGGDGADDLGDPSEVVGSFVVAAAERDTEAATTLLHPAHPFHPDNTDGDLEFERSLANLAAADVETELVAEDVPAGTVSERVRGTEYFFEEDELTDLLAGERTALVEATIFPEDGGPSEFLSVVVSHEGEWKLLWQGKPADPDPPSFETRVVEEVVFDDEEGVATVRFVDAPVAETVTVESDGPENADGFAVTEVSTDTPETTDQLRVSLDPEGDEVVVTATTDGDSRVVHRERYPLADRLVDEIIFDSESADDAFGPTARVELNDVQRDGELVATSTRGGGRSSIQPVGPADYLVVDVASGGDEVVVTLAEGGETTEIHRERYHP